MHKPSAAFSAAVIGVCVLAADRPPAVPAENENHLVPRSVIGGRLLDRAAEREPNAIAADSLLNLREVGDAAAISQHSGGRAALTTLTDDELRDLAARAEALDRDPAAGMGTRGWVLVVLLVVGVIALSTTKGDNIA